MPFLTTGDGTDIIRKISVDRPEMVIGRHPECEIVIDEGAVSRRHARLFEVAAVRGENAVAPVHHDNSLADALKHAGKKFDRLLIFLLQAVHDGDVAQHFQHAGYSAV